MDVPEYQFKLYVLCDLCSKPNYNWSFHDNYNTIQNVTKQFAKIIKQQPRTNVTGLCTT